MDDHQRAAGSWHGGRLCSCCHTLAERRTIARQARRRLTQADRRSAEVEFPLVEFPVVYP